MKIAVTGGAGYIGREFIKEYSDQYSIISLSRSKQDNAVQTDYSCQHLTEALAGCDAIVHLASQKATKDNEANGLTAYFDSIRILEETLKAAKELGIKNVIFTSSRCVYGTFTDTKFTETDYLEPINYYGICKIACEKLCEYYNQRFDMNIKVLRLGQVIGSDMNDKSLFNTFLHNAQSNLPLTIMGCDIRDYIYIKDVCRAIQCSIEHPECKGIYNISSGIGIDNQMIAKDMIAYFSSSSEIEIKEPTFHKKPDRIILDMTKAATELEFQCACPTVNDMLKDIFS